MTPEEIKEEAKACLLCLSFIESKKVISNDVAPLGELFPIIKIKTFLNKIINGK